ncbi:YpiF family protein [Paenibacillus sp. P25]|nr:YpiF family protein [Paenibacillus sp. P25]
MRLRKRAGTSLRPYLDTCLLPVTGLRGTEQPWEATEALEELRDALDLLEMPFKGRVVTYPALHFIPDDAAGTNALLRQVCSGIRQAGFRFVVLVTAKSESELPITAENADLLLRFTPEDLRNGPEESKRSASEWMTKLWSASHSL